MGYYRYCIKCDEGLSKPTLREDLLDGGQECWNCGQLQYELYNVKELVVEIVEHLEVKGIDLCY